MTRYWNDNLYLQQEDALAHYGVLGMHWGVRRYQNADGSLIGGSKKKKSTTKKNKGLIKTPFAITNALSTGINAKRINNILNNSTKKATGKLTGANKVVNRSVSKQLATKQYFDSTSRLQAIMEGIGTLTIGVASYTKATNYGSQLISATIAGGGAALLMSEVYRDRYESKSKK